MIKTAIIDYGMGNLDSAFRAVEINNGSPFIAKNPKDIKIATHIIIPGVGAYAAGMKNFIKSELIEPLKEQVIKNKKPLLGICLGMQILSEKGYEGTETTGLGLIKGEVKLLQTNNKNEHIPHIGWNEVIQNQKSVLFNNIPSYKDFYFVHSYHFICSKKNNILAATPYCDGFVAAVVKDNIFGTQFHPEKSQKYGLQLIKNFLDFQYA